MKSAVILLACVMFTGCTTFSVTQSDESQTPGEATADGSAIGAELRTISSEIKATSWFSSSQAIAGIKALQTDKTQSFGADIANQQGATNVVAALQAIAQIVSALKP